MARGSKKPVGSFKRVEPRSLHDAIAGGKPPLLVDVRTGMEFAGSHVAGAVNVPLNRITAGSPELAGAKEVWLICRTGSRSSHAGKMLASAGLKVVDVKGGLMSWRQAGYPVERGRSVANLALPAVASLTLGLAPFQPEPHVLEKLGMIAGGEAMAAIDFFDLAMHGAPWIWLIVAAVRLVLPKKG
jgi:rhodanese-related sulfurtransferase